VLHLDAFSGIAGNMFLAAMLDLGLSRKALEADLAGLGVEHRLRVSRVKRGALAARYLTVLEGSSGAKTHHHPHSHGRTFSDIRKLLGKAKLATAVRERTLEIFTALADAEARVHGTSPDEVHFHEVGAVDSIVDITGAAIALHRMEIERVTSTPVALGHGTVETDHGRLPLPAPATLELLRGIPTVPAHVAWETVTPTGAAILRCVVDEFCELPAMTIEAAGLGAGNDRPGPMPNVLRAVLGRTGGMGSDRVVALECNLDDLNPEHFDYLMDCLLEAGALDVSIQNVQMKKNRPAFLVRVLVRPSDRVELAQILFRESTTLGVRTSEWDRVVLERELRRVATPYGRIGVKLVTRLDGGVDVSAEYDDCKRAARKANVALRDVIRAAEACAREALE
jgi:uncharacterized protein (TIGR00299 family) protein